MKRLLFILLTIASTASAQNKVLFRIITLSYGVSLNGGAIAVGDDVTDASGMISIPKDGYLGVVTADGNIYELKNSIAVADVNAFVKSRMPVPIETRPPMPIPLDVSLGPIGRDLFGDSTFLVWDEYKDTDRVTGTEYEIQLYKHQELLDETSVGHNWILMDMKPYIEVGVGVTVAVVSKKTRSEGYFTFLRKGTGDKKLLNDLERLANHDDLAMLCAIFDINDYDYDRNFIAYKMLSSRYKPGGVLATYFGILTRDVDMR